VNGTVELELFKGSLRIVGRSSPDALYSEDLVSFDGTSLDQCHAIGVSHYYGIQGRMLKQQKKKKK
jgi:argininosuccinate synthase